MREHEMRIRVERVLRVCGRQALVPALGIGLTIGGCATGGSTRRPCPPIDDADTEGEAVGDPQHSNVVSIYSALAPRYDCEPPSPKAKPKPKPEAKPEPDQEFDPALDLP